MVAVAAALAVALVLSGCSFMGGTRTIGFLFPQEGGNGSLAVVLTDRSGAVTNAEPAPPDFKPVFDKGMSTLAGRPNAIVLHWIGGACDETVAITATANSGNLDFLVTTTRRPGGCDAMAIPRAVLIELSGPADPNRIGVRFGP